MHHRPQSAQLYTAYAPAPGVAGPPARTSRRQHSAFVSPSASPILANNTNPLHAAALIYGALPKGGGINPDRLSERSMASAIASASLAPQQHQNQSQNNNNPRFTSSSASSSPNPANSHRPLLAHGAHCRGWMLESVERMLPALADPSQSSSSSSSSSNNNGPRRPPSASVSSTGYMPQRSISALAAGVPTAFNTQAMATAAFPFPAPPQEPTATVAAAMKGQHVHLYGPQRPATAYGVPVPKQSPSHYAPPSVSPRLNQTADQRRLALATWLHTLDGAREKSHRSIDVRPFVEREQAHRSDWRNFEYDTQGNHVPIAQPPPPPVSTQPQAPLKVSVPVPVPSPRPSTARPAPSPPPTASPKAPMSVMNPASARGGRKGLMTQQRPATAAMAPSASPRSQSAQLHFNATQEAQSNNPAAIPHGFFVVPAAAAAQLAAISPEEKSQELAAYSPSMAPLSLSEEYGSLSAAQRFAATHPLNTLSHIPPQLPELATPQPTVAQVAIVDRNLLLSYFLSQSSLFRDTQGVRIENRELDDMIVRGQPLTDSSLSAFGVIELLELLDSVSYRCSSVRELLAGVTLLRAAASYHAAHPQAMGSRGFNVNEWMQLKKTIMLFLSAATCHLRDGNYDAPIVDTTKPQPPALSSLRESVLANLPPVDLAWPQFATLSEEQKAHYQPLPRYEVETVIDETTARFLQNPSAETISAPPTGDDAIYSPDGRPLGGSAGSFARAATTDQAFTTFTRADAAGTQAQNGGAKRRRILFDHVDDETATEESKQPMEESKENVPSPRPSTQGRPASAAVHSQAVGPVVTGPSSGASGANSLATVSQFNDFASIPPAVLSAVDALFDAKLVGPSSLWVLHAMHESRVHCKTFGELESIFAFARDFIEHLRLTRQLDLVLAANPFVYALLNTSFDEREWHVIPGTVSAAQRHSFHSTETSVREGERLLQEWKAGKSGSNVATTLTTSTTPAQKQRSASAHPSRQPHKHSLSSSIEPIDEHDYSIPPRSVRGGASSGSGFDVICYEQRQKLHAFFSSAQCQLFHHIRAPLSIADQDLNLMLDAFDDKRTRAAADENPLFAYLDGCNQVPRYFYTLQEMMLAVRVFPSINVVSEEDRQALWEFLCTSELMQEIRVETEDEVEDLNPPSRQVARLDTHDSHESSSESEFVLRVGVAGEYLNFLLLIFDYDVRRAQQALADLASDPRRERYQSFERLVEEIARRRGRERKVEALKARLAEQAAVPRLKAEAEAKARAEREQQLEREAKAEADRKEREKPLFTMQEGGESAKSLLTSPPPQVAAAPSKVRAPASVAPPRKASPPASNIVEFDFLANNKATLQAVVAQAAAPEPVANLPEIVSPRNAATATAPKFVSPVRPIAQAQQQQSRDSYEANAMPEEDPLDTTYYIPPHVPVTSSPALPQDEEEIKEVEPAPAPLPVLSHAAAHIYGDAAPAIIERQNQQSLRTPNAAHAESEMSYPAEAALPQSPARSHPEEDLLLAYPSYAYTAVPAPSATEPPEPLGSDLGVAASYSDNPAEQRFESYEEYMARQPAFDSAAPAKTQQPQPSEGVSVTLEPFGSSSHALKFEPAQTVTPAKPAVAMAPVVIASKPSPQRVIVLGGNGNSASAVPPATVAAPAVVLAPLSPAKAPAVIPGVGPSAPIVPSVVVAPAVVASPHKEAVSFQPAAQASLVHAAPMAVMVTPPSPVQTHSSIAPASVPAPTTATDVVSPADTETPRSPTVVVLPKSLPAADVKLDTVTETADEGMKTPSQITPAHSKHPSISAMPPSPAKEKEKEAATVIILAEQPVEQPQEPMKPVEVAPVPEVKSVEVQPVESKSVEVKPAVIEQKVEVASAPAAVVAVTPASAAPAQAPAVAAPSGPLCQMCKTATATKYCAACDLELCETNHCDNTLHSGAALQSHARVSFAEKAQAIQQHRMSGFPASLPSAPRGPLCQVCHAYSATLYCHDCGMDLCTEGQCDSTVHSAAVTQQHARVNIAQKDQAKAAASSVVAPVSQPVAVVTAPAVAVAPVQTPVVIATPAPAGPSEAQTLKSFIATQSDLWNSPFTLTDKEAQELITASGGKASFLTTHIPKLIEAHRKFHVVNELVAWTKQSQSGEVVYHAGNLLLLQALKAILENPASLILKDAAQRQQLFTTAKLDELVVASEGIDETLQHVQRLHELHRSFSTCDEFIASVRQAQEMGFFLPRPLLQKIVDYVKPKPAGTPSSQLFAPLNNVVPEMDAELLDSLISNLGRSLEEKDRWSESVESKVDLCIENLRRLDASAAQFDSWEKLCQTLLAVQAVDIKNKKAALANPEPVAAAAAAAAPATSAAPAASSASSVAPTASSVAPTIIVTPTADAAAPSTPGTAVPISPSSKRKSATFNSAGRDSGLLSQGAKEQIMAVLGDENFMLFEDVEEELSITSDALASLISAAGAHGVEGLVQILSGLNSIGRRAKSFNHLIEMVAEVVEDGAYSSRAARQAIISQLCSDECHLFCVGDQQQLSKHTIAFLSQTPPATLDHLILQLGGSSAVPSILEHIHNLDRVGNRYENFEEILSGLSYAFDMQGGAGSFLSKKDRTDFVSGVAQVVKKPNKKNASASSSVLAPEFKDKAALDAALRNGCSEALDNLFEAATDTAVVLKSIAANPVGGMMFSSSRDDEDEDAPSDMVPENGLELILEQLDSIQSSGVVYDSVLAFLQAATTKIAELKAAKEADQARKLEMIKRLNQR